MARFTLYRAVFVGMAMTLGWTCGISTADDSGNKPPADAPARTESKPSQSAALDRFETNVNSLKLTDDQKPKIDKLFESAKQDLKDAKALPDAKEREQKIHAVSTRLRSQIGEILTNEQKTELIKKMASQVDTAAMIERIKQELNKPGSKLTAEQKAKVDVVLDDTKKKLDDLQAEAKQTHVDNRAKVQAVLAGMRQKLTEILSGGSK